LDAGFACYVVAEGEELHSNLLSQDFDLIRAIARRTIARAAIGLPILSLGDSADERLALIPWLAGSAGH
jgi:hypothetical protein